MAKSADQNLPGRDIVWIFEFRSLEIVCNLQFDIWDFNKSMNCQQSKSPLGITKAWSFGPGFFTFLVTVLFFVDLVAQGM